jgi:hypothetical protein
MSVEMRFLSKKTLQQVFLCIFAPARNSRQAEDYAPIATGRPQARLDEPQAHKRKSLISL